MCTSQKDEMLFNLAQLCSSQVVVRVIAHCPPRQGDLRRVVLLGLTQWSPDIISLCRGQHPRREPRQHLQLLHDPGTAAWHRVHRHHQPHLWGHRGASGER